MGLRTNIADVRRQLQKADRDAKRQLRREIGDVMDEVFRKTQVKVPVATGALKGSGRLRETGDLTWTIHYGDSEVDRIGVFYAAAVHNRGASHRSPTGTKYVEEPLMESIPAHKAAAVRAMRKALG